MQSSIYATELTTFSPEAKDPIQLVENELPELIRKAEGDDFEAAIMTQIQDLTKALKEQKGTPVTDCLLKINKPFDAFMQQIKDRLKHGDAFIALIHKKFRNELIELLKTEAADQYLTYVGPIHGIELDWHSLCKKTQISLREALEDKQNGSIRDAIAKAPQLLKKTLIEKRLLNASENPLPKFDLSNNFATLKSYEVNHGPGKYRDSSMAHFEKLKNIFALIESDETIKKPMNCVIC